MLRVHPVILRPLTEISDQYHVPIALVAAVIATESNFDPLAAGDGGHSIGLMQLHDQGRGRYMSVQAREDIRTNILAGVDYLCTLYWQLGNWRMAISAYNQGLQGLLERGMSVNEGYIRAVITGWDKYAAEGIGELGEPLWREDV